MKTWLAAALVLAQISTAHAQTPPAAPTTSPAAPAQGAVPCSEIPQPPEAIDVARATPTTMSHASDQQAAWRAQAALVIECRRLYYNAAIDRFNEVNRAWSAQLDAFCARRNIRCAPREQQQPAPTPAQ